MNEYAKAAIIIMMTMTRPANSAVDIPLGAAVVGVVGVVVGVVVGGVVVGVVVVGIGVVVVVVGGGGVVVVVVAPIT